jgi:VanZ family protein
MGSGKGHRVNAYRAVTCWVPLALWIAFIFVMSSIPDLPGEYRDLPSHSDKVVHFIEYLILAILLYRGLRSDGAGRVSVVLTALVLIGIGVAGLDELYQSIVPGRDSSAADLASDIGGVTAGAAIMFYRWKRSLLKG